jgi:hypothetical protein
LDDTIHHDVEHEFDVWLCTIHLSTNGGECLAGEAPAKAGEKLWMVELIGIEPTTSGLQSQRSPN